VRKKEKSDKKLKNGKTRKERQKKKKKHASYLKRDMSHFWKGASTDHSREEFLGTEVLNYKDFLLNMKQQALSLILLTCEAKKYIVNGFAEN